AAAPREPASAERGSVRVGAARLDTLMNLVGELVTVQARLSRHAGLGVDPGLGAIAEEVERLTGDLRDVALDIRMVPVRPAFGRFRRMVRDLAQELGREVDLATEGEETELDKSLIDRLGDPVVHLLRNCVDHGIEPPAERERAGKPRRGLVRLGAYHAGPSVVIRVEDDGRGIDREAVRRKAVERGLFAKDESPPERELLALLFAPGFSTSTRLTSVSGRGVGLDVVKRAVESLRGAVRVESVPGAGTRFEIRLPLTLAIIEGLAVAVGEEHFILPLAAVRECVEAPPDLGPARRGCAIVEVRGEALPCVCLRTWFAIPGEPPPREQLVVVEGGGRRLGLRVDRVVGGHQTVIKPLGRLFRAARGLGGSTILGDGTVALILDVEEFGQDVEGAAAARAAAR
ncbi:MAG TPA: chemotaxis protein CheA, partial [Candidatus Methanoperedens sp.]|nr:chemotaxis protein CheA [Candidatus Methanoperedens sp.]